MQLIMRQVRADVVAVSMSWGGEETVEEKSLDSHFVSKSGAVFFASSGDDGWGASWPAASPNVVSVGGTSLSFKSDGTLNKETAWSGSGGGVSQLMKLSRIFKKIIQFQNAMACAQFPMLLITPTRNLDFQLIQIKNGMLLAEHRMRLRNGRQFNLWDFQPTDKNLYSDKDTNSYCKLFSRYCFRLKWRLQILLPSQKTL